MATACGCEICIEEKSRDGELIGDWLGENGMEMQWMLNVSRDRGASFTQ
jgi:hypothetical protein